MATATTTRKRATKDAAAPRRTAARPARATADGAGATRSRGRKARKLVIVESPAKARTVGNILGDDYTVIASVGHVRDLPPYGYGIEDFECFKPKYVVVKDKKRGVDKTEVIKDIAGAAKDAERVYLSTDPDREGEAISWHIREAAGIPPEKTTRVVFHEITKPAIEAAFAEAETGAASDGDSHGRKAPGQLDMDLVDAQQARRVLDRLIGFPLTWFVQGKVARSASAGRVQSVALRLIVERERQIRDFRATEYWSIKAQLAKQGRTFEAELAKLPGMTRQQSLKPPFENGRMPAIPDADTAGALVAAFERSAFSIAKVDRGSRKKGPLPPFTTSTFQQAANNRLGMGAQRAMGIAQELYEGDISGWSGGGLITYMRTDSLNISPLARGDARRYVAERWGSDYIPEKERVYSTRSKGAQEAHEAIRPTDVRRTPESLRRVLNNDQLRIYTLIWQRFAASQMSDARFSTMTVDIEAREGADLRGTFRASAQKLEFPGHMAAYGHHADDAEDRPDEDGETQLPENLAAGDQLDRRRVESKQHFTEPPARYTEASLVKALEELGIGRPSTYATIVQTVQKREYVKKEGRALVPQELGFLVNDLLVEHVDRYVATGFTSAMEEELDEVADGKRDYLSVVRDFWQEFEPDYTKAKESAGKVGEEPTDIECTACHQATLVIKWGRNGKFFACPRYPECSNSLPMGPDGQPVHIAAPTESAYACPKCGAKTVQKNGPFGPYLDCTNRDAKKCDFRSGVPVGVECPEEPGHGQLVEKRTRRGIFYGCWNYPNCSYTANTLDPAKMPAAREPAEREAANAKLKERSARGKAAFAARKANARKAS
ncbi:MAG: type I DNA topoisomerase [Dehalococcoidia bacterium]|nr:type I DNA topoisomerase [Dehalococcoidia bacterium]